MDSLSDDAEKTLEKKREAVRRWRAENKEYVAEYNKEYRRRPESKQRAKAAKKVLYRRDIEKARERNRIQYRKNREARLAYEKQRRINDPLFFKDKKLRLAYGITLEDFHRMMREQDNKCAICTGEFSGKSNRRSAASVDHCHKTGAVRALLCVNCNTGIGKLDDDPDRLRCAADYIERYRAKR